MKRSIVNIWVCRTVIALLVLAVTVFMSQCGGNGDGEEDADVVEQADVPEEEEEADAEVDVPADVPPEEGVEEEPAEDVPEDVPTDEVPEADVPVDGPETVSITGQVWSYTLMVGNQYYTEPAGGVTVSVPGTEVTAVTGTGDCDSWWNSGASFDCGKFTLESIAVDSSIMLKVEPSDEGNPYTISEIFTPVGGEHKVLVLVSQELINAMTTAWGITQEAGNGMIVGLLAQHVNPDPIYGGTDGCSEESPENCAVYGFIGDATIAITPDISDQAQVVYYNSSDHTDTSRTSTDPAQSLFFVLNVPPRDSSDPYTIEVSSGEFSFDTVSFAVDADSVTYLLLMPSP